MNETVNPRVMKTFRQVEVFGLYALTFVLPVVESPKHFALGIFFLATLGRRLLESPVSRRRPDSLEWLLLSMWAVALASTVANWPLPNGIKGLRSTTCMVFLFWAMYRGSFDARLVKGFLWALAAGVMVGLCMGLWEWQTGLRSELEFHSAGIVTQSSIYLAVALTAMAGALLDHVSPLSRRSRLILSGSALFSLLGLVLMGSRGAILGVLIVAGLMAPVLFRDRRVRRYVLTAVAFLALSTAAILALSPPSHNVGFRVTRLFKGFLPDPATNASVSENDLFRFEHWMVGYAQATQGGHMLLGIGPKNFKSVRVEHLELPRPLVTYPKIWTVPEHAHNLFLTKWVEEGLLGLIAFLLFLGAVARRLFSSRPKGSDVSWPWVAALGGLVIPVVAGSFNSSFENEFAWLAMMLMGLGLGRAKKTAE